MSEQALLQALQEQGVSAAATIAVDRIPFEPSLREACTPQRCPTYGKNWGCPPDIGAVENLITAAKTYARALIYETVHQLEDSFDMEGIQAGGLRHKEVTLAIDPIVREACGNDILHLSAGGCKICEHCSKKNEEPCRFPDKAMHSVSAYGIFVSKLAELAGLKYNNGPNTVTLFGIIFYHEK